MSKSDDIVVRKVTDDDFDGLVALYENVWPEVSYDKYEKANFVLRESNGVCYCAELNGNLVGSRTSFYMPIFYGNRKLNCVQFADSCVHSSCRRRGLFLRLNEAFLHDFFDERSGELVYNISVDDSRKAYEKLGWVYINSLAGLKMYPRLLHLFRAIGFKIQKLRGSVEWDHETNICDVDEELLEIREREFLKTECIHVRYDKDSFLWRLKSKNGIKIQMFEDFGCVIYKEGTKNGLKVVTIGDVFLYSYDYHSFKNLIKRFINTSKPDIVLATITIGHPLFCFYRRYFPKYNKLSFANHGVKVVSDEMREICLNPENWALSFMDIDTF